MIQILEILIVLTVFIWTLMPARRHEPDWQEDYMQALQEWEQSDTKKRLFALHARQDGEFNLSNAIGRKIGCITRSGMALDGGRWYVHTCCHGWVEVSGILQGTVKHSAWAGKGDGDFS